jgi:integrase
MSGYGNGSYHKVRPGVFRLRARGQSRNVEAAGPMEAKAKLREFIAELDREKERASGNSLAQLFELMLNDLDDNNRKDVATVRLRWNRHLKPVFGHVDAGALQPADISKYIRKRKDAGAANATVNRELAIIRRVLHLAHQDGRIPTEPPVKALSEKGNARRGFVERAVYLRFLEALPDQAKLPWVFGYHTGMRRGQLLELRWEWIDWERKTLAVPGDFTKNGEDNKVPIYGDMLPWLKWAWSTRNPDCPFIFQYRGRRLKSFKNAFNSTREKLGMPGTLFHDLRRTALRNMEREGIDRRDAMKISNHKTEAVYLRYAGISDERSVMEIGRRMEEYHRREAQKNNTAAEFVPELVPASTNPSEKPN